MMKRKDLETRLAEEAKRQGVEMTKREGGNHTVFFIGRRRVVVPRHREINELTAKGILNEAKGETK